MPTSLISTGLSNPKNDDEVDFYTLKYMANNARYMALDCVRDAVDAAGVSNSTLSKRLNWDKSRISRLLNTPSNMTMATLGELLFAIDGSAPVFSCNKPLDATATNFCQAETISHAGVLHSTGEPTTSTPPSSMNSFVFSENAGKEDA